LTRLALISAVFHSTLSFSRTAFLSSSGLAIFRRYHDKRN
jgi:hypothetical protein